MSQHISTDKDQDFAYKKRSLFGRRQGRAVKGERAGALATVLPQIETPKDKLKEDHKTQPSSIFNKQYSKYCLEIGFGHGERLIIDAHRSPETAFIGAEPFINGMADFLKHIQDDIPDNIRVLMDDGMIIADSLYPSSLDKIYILNPDPWHKKRHHKRRLINQMTLDVFAKILKPGGKLVMTSDVENLAEWMCTHACIHPNFQWLAKSKSDWNNAPENWIPTRYEQKGAKGAKKICLLYTSPSPRDQRGSRMPSSA